MKYIQSKNITCDEPIKKTLHQKVNRILFTYLLKQPISKLNIVV